jgi:hypothetical protein
VKVVTIAIGAALMVVVAGGTSGRLGASVCALPSGSALAVPATAAAHARHGGARRPTAHLTRPPVRYLALCARHRQLKKRLALPAACRFCWPRRVCGIEAEPARERHERAPSHTQLPRPPPLPSAQA